MADVNHAAFKARCTIGGIVIPRAHEFIIIAKRFDRARLHMKIFAPVPQCFSVIFAEDKNVDLCQSRAFELLVKYGTRGKNASGEDIFLDEVNTAFVMVEVFMLECNDLPSCAAARGE